MKLKIKSRHTYNFKILIVKNPKLGPEVSVPWFARSNKGGGKNILFLFIDVWLNIVIFVLVFVAHLD